MMMLAAKELSLRLAVSVVDEIEFGQFHQEVGLPLRISNLEFSATADDLLRRNAVDCFRPPVAGIRLHRRRR